MTVLNQSDLQRFVFDDVDWSFYEDICHKLQGRRVFITYHKGKLEVMTVSLLHEKVTELLKRMIHVLAEETDTAISSAGSATLKRQELDEGVQADASFYTANESTMRGKEIIDLDVDPPPDLAVEIEVTRRMGSRQQIYSDIGVPEIWRYGSAGLQVLIRRGDRYEPAERSPTFPQLSPQELFGFVAAGLASDETTWIKSFRQRVRQAIAQQP